MFKKASESLRSIPKFFWTQRTSAEPSPDGTGGIEELLNLRWDLSQLHCAKAAESVLLLLRQDDVVVPIVGCTLTVCFFAIFCQPFVVFCQRDVALLQLPKFSGFGRRSRRFQQLCVLCRFRTILLWREHQA